jgi:crotonobetainyl-CoA:carnitine CoA-transferase CaiB-like acyl-CoA transferase
MALSLGGVRVLDLSQLLAGPYDTQILGDLGAAAIKIEQPEVGDGCRGFPPHFRQGFSRYCLAVSRNEKSMTLELKQTDGCQMLHELVCRADVVYETSDRGRRALGDRLRQPENFEPSHHLLLGVGLRPNRTL